MADTDASKPPLIELARNNPEAFAQYAIQQIVAICGDGILRDGSPCSTQLRSFLRLQTTTKLSEHARQCLDHLYRLSVSLMCRSNFSRRSHSPIQPSVQMSAGTQYRMSVENAVALKVPAVD